jgi:hypothetical protein
MLVKCSGAKPGGRDGRELLDASGPVIRILALRVLGSRSILATTTQVARTAKAHSRLDR